MSAQGFFDDVTMWPTDFLWGGRDKAPIFGDRFDDKYEQGMVDALEQAQAQYEDYRPDVAWAQMNGLNQALKMFQPANERLMQMYGPSAGADLHVENPMQGIFRGQ